jgi:hypothetical protein
MTEGKFRMTCNDGFGAIDHLGPVALLRAADHLVCLKQRRKGVVVVQRRVRTSREDGHVDDVRNTRGDFHRQVRCFSPISLEFHRP